MKKIKKFKKLKPITIEIEKQGSEQDKHPDWMMGIIEAVASLENEKPKKAEEEKAEEPKKKKTADEKFKELEYVKKFEDDGEVIYADDFDSVIKIVAVTDPKVGYLAMAYRPDKNLGMDPQYLTDKEIKAIRRKAKEMGWR